MAGSGSEERVSEELIKRLTGDFDLESVLFLDLSDRSLTSVGALALCTSLRVLDLSLNQLTSLTDITALTQLEELDLSANQIASLDGFEKLESLRKLDLPGNNITQLEALLPLTGLVNLKTLLMKLPGSQLTNPVCEEPSYQMFMKEKFPTLVWLDGEKMSGAGSEFYTQCHEADRLLRERQENGGERGPLLPTGESVEDPLAHFSLNDDRATEMMTRLLSECDETSQKVHERITRLRKELRQS